MTVQDDCLLGNINKTKIAANEKRLDKVENIIIWTFRTSIATLLTVVLLLIKELI